MLFHEPEQRKSSSTPHLFPSPSPIHPLVSVSYGDHHYALLTSDGAVYTAGTGTYAELGYPSKGQAVPHKVAGLPPCQSVHCGEWHTAALARDGSVWTWSAEHHDGECRALSPLPVAAFAHPNVCAVFAAPSLAGAGAALCSAPTRWATALR